MDKKILHNILDRTCLEYPSNTAIEEGTRKIAYGNLAKVSNRVANSILETKTESGKITGIFIPAGIEYTAGIIGISKSGNIFMPLEVAYPVKRLEYLLDKTTPEIIITTPALASELFARLREFDEKPRYLRKILLLSADSNEMEILLIADGAFHSTTKKKFSSVRPDVSISGDDSLYLLNTSGSTGHPKMIEGMHKSLSHFIHWETQEFNLDSSIRVCQLARTSFDLSLREIFVPLMAGGVLCVPDTETKANPRKLLEWIGDSRLTLIHIVPSVFRLLVKQLMENPASKDKVCSLEHILLAGEPVYGKDITEWRSVAGDKAGLVNMYGPSETTLAKVFMRIEQKYEPQQIVPLGRPLPNTVVIILADGKLCNTGAIGEIYIKTPFRSKGYFKDPAMTAVKFVQNPLHNEFEDIVYQTGDLGKYLEDGVIAFAGRQDSQVKIRGNRVELSEVEQTILKHEGIRQVIVMPLRSIDDENVLACYYTAGPEMKEEELRIHLSAYLPEYMHPSWYTRMDDFPLNLNGKVEKKMLPRPEELLYLKQKYEAPSSELEKVLAGIWSTLLGLKMVGVNNSLFELGGHSLTITKMLAAIYKETGIEISLREAFDNLTIQKLATLIEKKRQIDYIPLDPAPQQPDYELSYPQKAIWLAEQLESDEPLYNIPYVYLLKGSLDKQACEKAFSAIIARHEALRTTFITKEGEPRQKIQSTIPFSISWHQEPFSDDKEDIIRQYSSEEASHRFSLQRGPLIRVKVIGLGKEEHLLLLTVHHIVFDGWSDEILIKELTHNYNSILRKEEYRIPPLRIQYKDYMVWYNRNLSGSNLVKLQEYWKERLGTDFERLQFPVDFLASDKRTFSGKRVLYDLDAEFLRTLEMLSRQSGCTPFMVCMTLTAILLYTYTGQRDFLIGTPMAGRNHKDLQDQIGMYVNVLPIRICLDPDDTFAGLLQKVRCWLVEATEYQFYPYLMMLEDLGLTSEDAHSPLLDVIVQSEDMPAETTTELTGLRAFACPSVVGSSKADLTFSFMIAGSLLTIEYKTDLYAPSTIDEIFSNIAGLMKTLGAGANQRLHAFPLLLSQEKEQEQEAFRQQMSGI